jgi:hypothetical protein
MCEPGQPDCEKRLEERFVRWQQELRRGLTSHVTLIISWSAGGLAFCGALLSSDHTRFGGIVTCFFLLTAFSFTVCLGMSLFISWNRLRDTRATLGILKARKDQASKETISALQAQTDDLEKRTWRAVDWQLVVFAAASILFVSSVLLAFQDRLWPCPHYHSGKPASSATSSPAPIPIPNVTTPKPAQQTNQYR